MNDPSPGQKPMLNVLIGRQLDAVDTGNAAYLMVFLRTARAAGLGVRLLMAHSRSFSNRPWLTLHPAFLPLIDEVCWPWSVRINNRFWSLAPSVWGRFVIRIGKLIAQKLGVRSPALTEVRSTLADLLPANESAGLARLSDRKAAAIVMAEYSSLGPVLRDLKAPVAKAVLLHDLFSIRADSFRQRGEAPDFRAPTLEEEAADVAAADLLVFASANELRRLAPFVPEASAIWLRPEVPAYAIPTDAGAPRVVFMGTRHAGNVDALNALLDDIWPIVLKSRPEAELWVAGSICADVKPAQAALPGVKRLGRVHDLSTLGGAQSIGVAPTRIASGVSIKVAEYLRLGMPSVAYPVALEGFGPELDDLVDVVHGPEAFAARLVELLDSGDLRTARGEHGRTEAARRLDNTPVAEALQQLMAGRADAPARAITSTGHFASAPPPEASAGFAASSRHS